MCKSKVLQKQPLDEAYDIIWRMYVSVRFAKRLNDLRSHGTVTDLCFADLLVLLSYRRTESCTVLLFSTEVHAQYFVARTSGVHLYPWQENQP